MGIKYCILALLLIGAVHLDGQSIHNYKGYTVNYNDSLQTPNWVSYRVTDDDRGRYPRVGFWSPLGTLSQSEYTNSGFDRGHMAPAGNFSHDSLMMHESFSMHNICPQTSYINRKLWRYLEGYERTLAKRRGCLYIVVYANDPKKIGKLYVPESLTKVICDCDMTNCQTIIIENIEDF